MNKLTENKSEPKIINLKFHFKLNSNLSVFNPKISNPNPAYIKYLTPLLNVIIKSSET